MILFICWYIRGSWPPPPHPQYHKAGYATDTAHVTSLLGFVSTSQAKDVVRNAADSLERIKGLLSQNMLPGEQPVKVSAPSISLSIQRDAADAVCGRAIEEDSGSVQVPTWCELQDIPDDQCDTSTVIDLQVSQGIGHTKCFSRR